MFNLAMISSFLLCYKIIKTIFSLLKQFPLFALLFPWMNFFELSQTFKTFLLWMWTYFVLRVKNYFVLVLNSLKPFWLSFEGFKETNWVMNQVMCVLLLGVFKHLLLRETDVLKTCRKSKFLGKKIWRYSPALKIKKVQGIFGKTFAPLSSAVFCLKKRVSGFF